LAGAPKSTRRVDDNELPKRNRIKTKQNDATMPHHRLARGSSTTSSLPSYDGGSSQQAQRPMKNASS